VVASHLYRGRPIELRDQDLVGLVPIGMNPVTKLWEFYELRSAWNFEDDPVAIPIPAHRSDGSIEVTDDTGIVFVLLPGGTFRMGAQNQDKEKPSFDPQARRDETPHAVTLVPYFMARHELTQGQWRRLGRGNADLPKPSQYTPGQHYAGRVTWTNPVEQVNWELCNMLLEQCGLELPTEAQWEYACRAGASTPWLCAPEDLHKHGNLADASARDVEACLASEAWNDGYALHAPVGSFVANAFGLYDMQGNVSEWCRDEYESYGVPGRADDGLRLRDNGVFNRCYRGGGFGHVAGHARSAYRDQLPPTSSFSGLGLRCARTLRH